MKLRGEFVVRQIMDSTVAIPVGQAALQLNGMILLNDVSKIIWECLEQETTPEHIVTALTDAFEVSPEEALADILDFIEKLRKMQLLDE
jgi:hypothetical protein